MNAKKARDTAVLVNSQKILNLIEEEAKKGGFSILIPEKDIHYLSIKYLNTLGFSIRGSNKALVIISWYD